jgi:nitrate reductase molybdenum cofactor assembly chaperone NarJ/NarW
MTPATTVQSICCHFAELCSYPTADLASTVAACSALLRKDYPESASSLEHFAGFLHAQLPARLEEIYTATFDLQPVCHPYVGYQLCGESQQRAMFLMQLNRLYLSYGFVPGVELPDHLSTLLRFIGTRAPLDCRRELIEDGLLPALAKMLEGPDSLAHPYSAPLQALRSFLQVVVEPELPAAGRLEECPL